jgi:hypothetical protein
MHQAPAPILESISTENHVRLRPWRELAVFASIIMEMSWIVLWYRILIRSGSAVSYPQAFGILSGLFSFSYLVTRLMDYFQVRLTLRRWIMAVLILMSLPLALTTLVDSYRFEIGGIQNFFSQPVGTFAEMINLIPAEFVVVLLVLWIWWRGISQINKQIGPTNMVSEFRSGVIAFFIYGLILPFTGDRPGLALYIFLFSGLLAMIASRISVLSYLRGGHKVSFDRRWLIGSTLVVSITVAISASLANLLGGRAFDLLTKIYAWIILGLTIIIAPLSWLLIRLIFWLGEKLRFAEVFQAVVNLIQKIEETLQNFFKGLDQLFKGLNSPVLQKIFNFIVSLKPLLLWGLILLAIVVILATLRYYVWREEDVGQEDLQPEIDQGNALDQLRAALRRRFSRIVDRLSQASNLRIARNYLAAARIRRIYGRLLDLSAKLDHPRPASCTPLEFLPKLDGLFPRFSGDLRTITNAYLRVRYGELSETLQEVEEVERAWQHVANQGRIQLAEKKHK